MIIVSHKYWLGLYMIMEDMIISRFKGAKVPNQNPLMQRSLYNQNLKF